MSDTNPVLKYWPQDIWHNSRFTVLTTGCLTQIQFYSIDHRISDIILVLQYWPQDVWNKSSFKVLIQHVWHNLSFIARTTGCLSVEHFLWFNMSKHPLNVLWSLSLSLFCTTRTRTYTHTQLYKCTHTHTHTHTVTQTHSLSFFHWESLSHKVIETQRGVLTLEVFDVVLAFVVVVSCGGSVVVVATASDVDVSRFLSFICPLTLKFRKPGFSGRAYNNC